MPYYRRRMMPYAHGLGKPVNRNARTRAQFGWKKKKKPWKGKVGNKKIRNLKRTQMGRVGLSAALALKTLKKHEPTVSTNQIWKTTGTVGTPDALHGSPPDRFEVVHPFYLVKSASRDETKRECDNIYFFNCRGQFEIQCPDTQHHPLVIRVVQGYAIGVPDANAGTGPTQAKTPWDLSKSNSLSYYLQTPECKLDPDYYKVHYDKQFTIRPTQVYYDGTHTKAVWKPYKVNFNMKFNKKVMYDGGAATDSVGWIPFIGVAHYHIGDGAPTTSSLNDNTHPSRS